MQEHRWLSRGRGCRWAFAVAVTTIGAAGVFAPTASAVPVIAGSTVLSYGSSGFITNLSRADGQIQAVAGARRLAGRNVRIAFVGAGGNLNTSGAPRGSLRMNGTMTFLRVSPVRAGGRSAGSVVGRLLTSNWQLQLNGRTGTASALVRVDRQRPRRIALVRLVPRDSVRQRGVALSIPRLGSTLTAAGAKLFSDFYTAPLAGQPAPGAAGGQQPRFTAGQTFGDWSVTVRRRLVPRT
jgi:hypothetical protein